MSSTFKLIYFDFEALGEPIRLLFASAGVQFQDVRIAKSDWPQYKSLMPWNKLPVLEENGKQLSESLTIVRYLGRKFKLAGKNEFETAKCNEYIDAIVDIRLEMLTKYLLEENETKKSEFISKFRLEILPNIYQKYSNILKENGTGFLVGSGITYADIYIVSIMNYLHRRLHLEVSDQFREFPLLLTHMNTVINSPGIKTWIENRPQRPY